MTTETKNQVCKKLSVALAVLVVLLAGSVAAQAATFEIINLDAGTGQGFDDPTVVAPVGGNPGQTLGEQRLNVFTKATEMWGGVLRSDIPIVVEASFGPLGCEAGEPVTLGAAGPGLLNHPGEAYPVANTWIPNSLYNSLSGQDYSEYPDIITFFNSDVDGACLAQSVFYYGYDGLPSGDDVDLLTVVLHELGHGLGFSTTTFIDTGEQDGGFPGLWDYFLYDETLGLTWDEMTDTERADSAISMGQLTWSGNQVTTEALSLSAGVHLSGRVQMYTPEILDLGSSVNHFEQSVDPNSLMEPNYDGVPDLPRLTVALFQDLGWQTHDLCAWGCPYSTLMDALQGSGQGDTISIGPGTYVQPSGIVHYNSRKTLRGEDPETTILETDADSRILRLLGSQTDYKIENLTLRNGNKLNGPGGCLIAESGARVELTNSVVEDCHTDRGGGGLAAYGSGTELILDATKVRNNSSVWTGGGVRVDNNATLIVRNQSEITGNASGNKGGGITCRGGCQATVSSSKVADNTAGTGGDGAPGIPATALSVIETSVLNVEASSEIVGTCYAASTAELNDDGTTTGSGCF